MKIAWTLGVAFVCLSVIGCGSGATYGGHCGDIALGTKVSDLPAKAASTTNPSTGLLQKGISCDPRPDAGAPDCTYRSVGAPYAGSGCDLSKNPGKILECGVWSDSTGKVIGVWAWCESYN